MSTPPDPGSAPAPSEGSGGTSLTAPGDTAEAESGLPRKRIGLAAGVLLALALYFILPDSLEHPGKVTAAVATLMAVWWMTEAIPLPATALLPLVLFPVLIGADIADVAAPYASDVIFLFMGGFMLAMAMQRWNLHRRIALVVVSAVGTSPVMLIAGFMLATGFVTMWVSNTATTVMMLPIGLSVLGLVNQLGDGKGDANFATSLMLGIAYSASIGSVATLIGTPPNAFMAGYLAENHDINVGFGQWMLVGLPLAAVFLVVAWFVLTRLIYPPGIRTLPGGRQLVRDQLHQMGPMSRGEWTVLIVFVCAAVAWVAIPPLADSETIGTALPWLANISDAGIAMAVAVALFLIPVKPRQGVPALDWSTALELPWGILLLFGGGIALSAQFEDNELSSWIGEQVGLLSAVPAWLVVAIVAGLVLLLTELTSNTATANIFLPVLAGVAVGLDMDIMLLIVPAALAASLAFMLPVATPPNAIAFGSGYIRIGQMVRAGIWLNAIALVLVMAVMYTIAYWVFSLG